MFGVLYYPEQDGCLNPEGEVEKNNNNNYNDIIPKYTQVLATC